MATARIKVPPKLKPVFLGSARVRGAYGGRGSAKTRTFAKMAAVKAYQFAKSGREGIILCCRQFMNSLDESSLEEIKAAIRSEAWLAVHFEIGEKYVRTTCGRVAFKFVGLDRNIDSIKSKARILLCWVDEAEPVIETAWQKLIPTIREEESELWVTWNPERETSPTHKRFRLATADDMKVVELNWRDNPWFPGILERVRQDDLEKRPESYDHIWEGAFKTYFVGAYFTRELVEAKGKGRIGNVSADPLMTYRAFWDIGGAGAKADSTAIWIAQFIGTNIHVLDYYEAQGQPLATHVNWLRANGYGNALCVLPHDGAHTEKVFDASYEGSLRQAGFEVKVVPNQGRGAAMARVESFRRQFPRIWFNDATTTAGRDALAAYHEKRDEERNIGLGPNHDWSSHGADAFGLMCVAYEAPKVERPKPTRQHHGGAGAWMG
jgi:phage terminase large subunit